MDERLILSEILISFTNDQKAGKTKLLVQFEELDEKPTELAIVIPNPYLSRAETIDMLQRRVDTLQAKIKDYKRFHKLVKGEPQEDDLDEFD